MSAETFTNEEKRRVQLTPTGALLAASIRLGNVQANDNANISRAKRLLDHLQKVGKLDRKISCDK